MRRVQAARRRRGSDRGRDRHLEGQGRRRHQGQRHRGRDRDRQVAGRAALAVRRHGQALHVPEGETVAGRHPDHLRRRRRRPTQPDAAATESAAYLAPTARDRHVQPGRDRRRGEPDAGRLRPASRGSRARAAPAGATRRPRTEAGAAAQLQLQGAFGPGVRRHLRRRGAPTSRRCRAAPAAAPTRLPARTSRARQAAGAQARQGPRHRPRSLTPTGPGGTVTREDVEAAAERRCRVPRRACRVRRGAPASATARADQGRPQDDGAGDGGVRVHRCRTSPSGSPSTPPAR